MDKDLVYTDNMVEITADDICFRNYSLFGRPRRVDIDNIETVECLPPTLGNGKFRFHGTGDFKTWFAKDPDRTRRDAIFLARLKDGWWNVGFTVEDSAAVRAFFQEKGLLREEEKAA